MMIRSLCLILVVATVLSGCASPPELRAAWYMSYKQTVLLPNGQGAAAAAPVLDDEEVDDIHVALLNAGARTATIHRLWLLSDDRYSMGNAGELTSWPSEPDAPRLLAPGEMIVVGMRKLINEAARSCRIPLGVHVRWGKRPSQEQLVEIKGLLPTSLPRDWLICSGRKGQPGVE